jgi:hypothetical protein
VPSRAAVLRHPTIGGEEPLRVSGRFEALHAPLPLTRRLMGILCTVLEIAVLAVLHTGSRVPLGGLIAFELIGDHHSRDVLQALEQLTEELLRRLLVAPTLHQNIVDLAVLIHRPPEVLTIAVGRVLSWPGLST